MNFSRLALVAILTIFCATALAAPKARQSIKRAAAKAIVHKGAVRNTPRRPVVQPAKARAALNAVNARRAPNRGMRTAVVGAARLRAAGRKATPARGAKRSAQSPRKSNARRPAAGGANLALAYMPGSAYTAPTTPAYIPAATPDPTYEAPTYTPAPAYVPAASPAPTPAFAPAPVRNPNATHAPRPAANNDEADLREALRQSELEAQAAAARRPENARTPAPHAPRPAANNDEADLREALRQSELEAQAAAARRPENARTPAPHAPRPAANNDDADLREALRQSELEAQAAAARRPANAEAPAPDAPRPANPANNEDADLREALRQSELEAQAAAARRPGNAEAPAPDAPRPANPANDEDADLREALRQSELEAQAAAHKAGKPADAPKNNGGDAPAPKKEEKEALKNCGICLDAYAKNATVTLECTHECHAPCLERMVSVGLKDKNTENIKCPVCAKRLSANDIAKITKDDKQKADLEKIARREASNQLRGLPGMKGCPTPDCLGVFENSANVAQNYQCPECKHHYCSACLTNPHHPGMSCEAATQAGIERKAKNAANPEHERQNAKWKAENTKPCPSCKLAIERMRNSDGTWTACNHMTCNNCKHQFCWDCNRPTRQACPCRLRKYGVRMPGG